MMKLKDAWSCEINASFLQTLLKLFSFCCAEAAEGKAVVDQVMTSVKGGTVAAAAGMRAKLNKDGVMDVATYQNWAKSIADVPALINSEVDGLFTWISSNKCWMFR